MENNKRKALGMGLEQLFNAQSVDLNSFEQNIVEDASLNDILDVLFPKSYNNCLFHLPLF